MHKKSFTFGLGLGILAMTVVFFFAYTAVKTGWTEKIADASANSTAVTPLTDAEIKERALALGMVDAKALQTATPMATATAVPPAATVTPATATVAPTGTVAPMATPVPTVAPTATIAPTNAPTPSAETGFITFTIEEGLVAADICILLEDVGVIDDAVAFEAYLSGLGLTTRLAHGTYTVPAGCTYDELMEYWKHR